MAIAFSCPTCDSPYTVDDKFAGKVTACKGCRGRLVVPEAAPATPDEDAAFALLSADDGKGEVNPRLDRRSWEAPPPPPAAARPPAADPGDASQAVAAAAAARYAKEAARERRKARSDDADDGGGRRGLSISPTAMGGLGMMALAVVWFGLGFAAGRIYPYTAVLFVLGLFSFVKGLMGHED